MMGFLAIVQLLFGIVFTWKALSNPNEDAAYGAVGMVFAGLSFWTSYALFTVALS